MIVSNFTAVTILLMPTIVFAGDATSNVLNSVPIFAGAVSDTKYKAAASKMQEAVFLQTGISQNIDLIGNALSKEATVKATIIINNNTPFNARHVFFVGSIVYSAGVTKQVSKKFKDPFFTNVSDVIILGKDKGSFTFVLPF